VGTTLIERVMETGSLVVRKLGRDRAGEIAIHRFLSAASVTCSEMVATLATRTAAACTGRRIVAAQDTTEINFAGREERRRGLGPAGDGMSAGFFIHPVIAIDSETEAVLGLLDARIWTRTDEFIAPPVRARTLEDKESIRWLDGAAQAGTHLSKAASVVVVADRESDIYAGFAWRPASVDLIVRAAQDRALHDGASLFAAAAGWPELARTEVLVAPSRTGVRGRIATVALRAGPVVICRPRHGHDPSAPPQLTLTMVEAREVEGDGDGQPLLWRLLTTLEVADAAGAADIVRLYRLRWRIEEIFRSLKADGMRLEDTQMQDAAAFGHAEAAFNAGLMHDEGNGVPPSQDKARDLYRRGAELGHVASMTNLTCKIMEQDPEEAIAPLERATAAGDDKAAGLLDAWTETGMARAAGSSHGLEEDGPPPPIVRVVPSGAWRPKAIAAALRDGADASSKDAEGIAAFMFGFGSWRELVRTATKGKADPPGEACDAAEVRRRRTYQTYVLAECSDMGPEAASIAIEALRPTAKAGRPVLDRDTQARMRAASQAYAGIWGDEELGDEGDLDSLEDLEAADVAAAVVVIMEAAGIDPEGDPLGMLDELRRMGPIQPDVWLGLMEERLGWVFAEVDEDAQDDGDQVAVAVGSGGRRVPVIMSAVACIPGDPGDRQVARLKADIGAAHPAGAVLVFNKPVGWLPEQGGGGLVHGGLLWSDDAWSGFVLRPGGGLDDALSQRGRDLAHPDARIVAELGFAEASGVLHSLAAYLAGLKPDEADVQFLHSANG